GVPAMDSTGLRALTTLVERRVKTGVPVFVVGLQEQPRKLILRSRLADLLGRERLDLSAEEAVEMIRNFGLIITSREAAIPRLESQAGRGEGHQASPEERLAPREHPTSADRKDPDLFD